MYPFGRTARARPSARQETRGGAADKAGIEAGDVITRLGETDITTITSLSEALAAEKPGARTSVTFTRNGTEKKVDVTLGEQ